MAYLFLSDGGPEAEDYDSNYYYFDASDKAALTAIEEMMIHEDSQDPEIKARLCRICRESIKSNDSWNLFKRLSAWYRRFAVNFNPGYFRPTINS
ncbi:hypothetical protein HRM2_39860 [Desulforapulum autotrophicum HRM2]|uniref:Uncharacterized protein n=1 Tax=Desulforapulum autotrophicum (strain ATCC 43914 / DSM 3382 / VKM B-1955 / HRM2) TaxID=177437 RepID=C0QBP2_DESAH|nr:hypothetical protein [Desulforapulum autotrophicum]ACN17044.1 hypothetical protein HRM2_39860 [Desulforapulum autotrophicum HRM2]